MLKEKSGKEKFKEWLKGIDIKKVEKDINENFKKPLPKSVQERLDRMIEYNKLCEREMKSNRIISGETPDGYYECYIMEDNRIEVNGGLDYYVEKRRGRIFIGELGKPVNIQKDLPDYMLSKTLRELIDVQDEKLISIIRNSEEEL